LKAARILYLGHELSSSTLKDRLKLANSKLWQVYRGSDAIVQTHYGRDYRAVKKPQPFTNIS